MITEYITAALSKARYEIIEDEEPYLWRSPRAKRCLGNRKNSRRMPFKFG